MPDFSAGSKAKLATAATDLQIVFNEVIRHYDCKILEGHRSIERQKELFAQGVTHKDGVSSLSKHNSTPSRAIDVVPYPVIWPNREAMDPETYERTLGRFYEFAGFVQGIAEQFSVPLRWGGDWDGDHEYTDQKFHDLPHFETTSR